MESPLESKNNPMEPLFSPFSCKWRLCDPEPTTPLTPKLVEELLISFLSNFPIM
jgi:hypothetical protein